MVLLGDWGVAGHYAGSANGRRRARLEVSLPRRNQRGSGPAKAILFQAALGLTQRQGGVRRWSGSLESLTRLAAGLHSLRGARRFFMAAARRPQREQWTSPLARDLFSTASLTHRPSRGRVGQQTVVRRLRSTANTTGPRSAAGVGHLAVSEQKKESSLSNATAGRY